MTRGADAPRLWLILIMTESSIGLRSPLSMPRHPARAAHAARRVRRVFDAGVHRDAPDGRVASAICAFRDRFQKTGLASACAGEAFVLSQVNPELVV